MLTTEEKQILFYSLDQDITLKKLKEMSDYPLDSERTEKLLKWMEKYHIQGYTSSSDHYPVKFRLIPNGPYLFYAIGNVDLCQQKILWIVGPRFMSSYAEQLLEELFKEIESKRLVTVSWMANGIDQKCHKLSLQHHLPTIAILWWWLRKYLESEDRFLIEDIIRNWWCIISEFKLNFKPTNWSFPQRNRLIAWLSDVLFIPEAKEHSWSLITADFAFQYKKKIFIAPNQLFAPNGKGSNQFLAEKKADLLFSFQQISSLFEDNKDDPLPKTSLPSLTEIEQQVINLVKEHATQDISWWIYKTSLESSEILSTLTMLEIKGMIYQSSPWIYEIKSS